MNVTTNIRYGVRPIQDGKKYEKYFDTSLLKNDDKINFDHKTVQDTLRYMELIANKYKGDTAKITKMPMPTLAKAISRWNTAGRQVKLEEFIATDMQKNSNNYKSTAKKKKAKKSVVKTAKKQAKKSVAKKKIATKTKSPKKISVKKKLVKKTIPKKEMKEDDLPF